jgi:F-type H+-transporting ATPase subunit b
MKMVERMTKSKHARIFSLCLFATVFMAATAFGIGGEGEAKHVPLWKEFLWPVVNFSILVVILIKFVKKPFQDFLKERTDLIRKTLDEARQAKELAQKALQEVEGRLKTKDKEIEQIVSVSQRTGEIERDELIKEGDKLREKILEQARINIEFELKSAKEAIKAEAVELAMELAEKKIKDTVNKEAQEKLLEESLTKIGGRG